MSMLLLCFASPQSSRFSGYKAVEAYEVRPGILMMPRYSDNGEVCEIGLEGRHYSPEKIRLFSSLPRKEIDQILEELVPTNERGPKTTLRAGTDLIGQGLVTFSDYENISIQIYSAVLPTSKKHEMVSDDIAATIRWKNRKCR
jgi:hypothetical protein